MERFTLLLFNVCSPPDDQLRNQQALGQLF